MLLTVMKAGQKQREKQRSGWANPSESAAHTLHNTGLPSVACSAMESQILVKASRTLPVCAHLEQNQSKLLSMKCLRMK